MKIKEREEYMWHSRTLQPQFELFKRIHCDFHIHFVWLISKLKPKLLAAAKSIVQMISWLIDETDSVLLCANCNNGYVNIIDHCISECTYVHLERVSLLDKIYQFDPNVYLYLRRLDKASLTSAFLGEERVDFVSLLSDNCTRFWFLCLPALHRIWLTYNS